MKAVIPAAGEGTRLYPQTHTKPKAMVRLAGKPILGHLLDQVVETAIDGVVVVVGSQKGHQIVDYATEAYGDRLSLSFPEQAVARGLGHGVYQAREAVGTDAVFVVLGDMLFVDGYSGFLDAHRSNGADATIGVQQVDEPQHYGVVEFDADERITRLLEKPPDPPSNYAISGLYAVEDGPTLFDALEGLIADDDRGAGGEFQLTDAFQRMVDAGETLRAAEVSSWYDCGRPEPLLDVNRVLLDRRDQSAPTAREVPGASEDAVVVPPVDIGRNVGIESSVVGPYVSVDRGTTIRDCVVRDSIVGRGAELDGLTLERSLVADEAAITSDPLRLNVGANDRLHL